MQLHIRGDPIEFIPFSRDCAYLRHTRHLPHLRQDGATYFVTFRLADSIPRRTMEAWNAERRTWAEAHGVEGNPGSPVWQQNYARLPESVREAYEKHFARRYHRALDRCHGSCLLRQQQYAAVVLSTLCFWHEAKGVVGDVVVMPNHVHVLAIPCAELDVGEWIGRVKRFAAREINAAAGRTGRTFWQEETYDHIVRDQDELARIRRYIRANPEHSHLEEGDFLYHHAEWMDTWCDMDSSWLRGNRRDKMPRMD